MMSSSGKQPQPSLAVLTTPARKTSSRARTRCITCRIRKVKCDEAKPSCLRCTSTGRKCDGYGDPETPRHTPIGRAFNNGYHLGVELNIRDFDYYRSHVSIQIGDFSAKDFWSNLVLRLAPTDPAIRHAISAVSLLYAGKARHTRERSSNYVPAIIQYNKAITAVRSWSPATESRVKPLLVCLLFICIEYMLGHEHQMAAIMHISQGRKLLAQLTDNRSPEIDIIREHLAPIYLRLAFIGIHNVDFPRHLLKLTSIPHRFASLADAQSMLHFLGDEGLRFIYDVKSFPGQWKLEDGFNMRLKEIHQQMASWRHAFDALLAFSDLDKEDIRTVKLLEMRHSLTHLYLVSMISGSEYTCDKDSIYDMAISTDAAAHVVQYDAKTLQGPSFTFESEVVGSIYWVAVKCRQPVIRRRALEVLYNRQRTKRVESLTMVREAILMATRVIEIEEDGLEVPCGTQKINEKLLFRVVSRVETGERTGDQDTEEQKEQWSILWGLANDSSEIRGTKLGRLAAKREEQEVAEGLAKGWPRERLIWPYGITRERRVLNIVIKKHASNAIWLEYYREPLVAGGEYRVMKEHIEFA